MGGVGSVGGVGRGGSSLLERENDVVLANFHSIFTIAK